MITILIVDDEHMFRQAAASLLRRDGHTVFEASTALEAMGIIERQDLDLAIIDFELGTTLTGLDVARHTKLGTERIMITGYDPDVMRPKWEDPLRLFRAIFGKPPDWAKLRAVADRVEKSKEDTVP